MLDYRITALAVDPAQPQTVYAGADAGEFFKSTDGGQSWNDFTDRLPPLMYSHPTVRDIVVDPAAPETVYLLADYRGVLVSHDRGERWRALGSPGEIDHPGFTAMAAIFDPQLVLVVGIEREGGWRYATDQPTQAATGEKTTSSDSLQANTPTPIPTLTVADFPPTLTPTSAPTDAAPQPTATSALPPASCSDPRATIIFPFNGDTIQGIVPFIGTANVDNLKFYKFEYKPAHSATWQFLTQVDNAPVADDILMTFNTSTIAPGVYDFRLIVVDQTGNYPPPCEIQVTVQR
jgi:hypothetical protein